MNWLRRQRSNQVNQDDESIYNGLTAAIAAAAFAIHSHEQSENGKMIRNGTRKEDAKSKLPRSGEVTRQFSYRKTKAAGETSMRRPSRSSSNNHKSSENDGEVEKAKRNYKLKSILAWANAKTTKVKT